jgi:hypothetical protein
MNECKAMTTRLLSTFLLPIPLLSLAALAPSARASDTVRPGFQVSGTLPLPVVGAAYATLKDDRYFYFDGLNFELHARDGALLANLGSLSAFVYPSFAILDPTGSFALTGESTNGDIYRVELSGAGYSVLTNLTFNYDAEFDADPAFVWVSAATGGFSNGNDLFHVEIASGVTTQVAHVDGASGPLAVDEAGDVYYGDVSADFCPPPGSADVLRWDRALLLSGQVHDESDASVFSADYDGASSLAFDPVSGHLFVTEMDYCSSVGRIREMDENGLRRAISIESVNAISNLEFAGGNAEATFQPYQPANVRLRYNSTDFVAFTSTVVTVKPRRPGAAISGPSSGPGAVTLTITNAEPNAGVYVLFGPRTEYDEDEIVYDLGYGFPVHFALPVNKIRRVPLPIPTDAFGTATFTYYDPGSLHGLLVFQALAIDAHGVPLGTSKAALN